MKIICVSQRLPPSNKPLPAAPNRCHSVSHGFGLGHLSFYLQHPIHKLRRQWRLFAEEGFHSVEEEFYYEFGRPSAPKETWQRFAAEARAALLEEMSKENIDVLYAALHIACEDDANKERSVVKLPVDAYSKRLDSMVKEMERLHLPALEEPSPQELLDCIDAYLYTAQRFALAEGPLELNSPYRINAHNVLAQKCGTPVGLAVVHLGLLQRLKAAGALGAADFELVLPASGGRPYARAPGPETSGAGIVLTPRRLVLMLLNDLKRSSWPWEWPQGARSGFLPAAEAALGASGRVGTADSTTGVLQGKGRPFGDLARALLASERLVLLGGARLHLRDSGILLYHLGRHEESYMALKKYQELVAASEDADEPSDEDIAASAPNRPSLEGMRAELNTIAEERSLVDKVIVKLERIKAESSWTL